jgi:uridine phosphorylase
MDHRYKGAKSKEALFTAKQYLQSVSRQESLSETTVVIAFDPSLTKFLKSLEAPDAVLIQGCKGIGSPSLALQMEMLAAQGVERIVTLGTAGSFDSALKFGTAVVAKRALIDEGTSPHYGREPGEIVEANSELLKKFSSDWQSVSAWTTDAPYRETAAEIEHYLQAGLQCVEMETSALYSVGHALGLQVLAFYVVSDELFGGKWQPHFHNPLLRTELESLGRRVLLGLSS